MAPRVGFEPTTYRLTAGRSTVELSGIAFAIERGKVYHRRNAVMQTEMHTWVSGRPTLSEGCVVHVESERVS
jgi:hypothetical protein